MSYWFEGVLRLLPPTLLALLLWLVFDFRAGAAFFVGILVFNYVAHHVQLSRFRDWVKLKGLKALAAEMSDVKGAWGDLFASLYYLRRDEAQLQQSLTTSLNQFRQAAEVIPDGIVLMDRFLKIDWNNGAAMRYLTISFERDRGLSIMDLIRDPKFTEYVNNPIRASAVVIKTTTEPIRTLSLLLRPFGNHQYILLCKDITAFERVDTMRRDFVANVSHELKTPLTVIIGFLEGLIEHGTQLSSADVTRQFALMQEQALRMNRLVSDLLTLSKLEETSMPGNQEKIDVPALLESLLEEARALSNGCHALTAQISWTLFLHGNRDELHSAFSNLISNAIRYTPEGGKISIRWFLREKQPVFEVTDTGIGIAPEHVSRLTERFYRVDKSRSSDTGGTGLGLAIVKHVLLRHQALLDIESRLGEGSSFRAVFSAERLV